MSTSYSQLAAGILNAQRRAIAERTAEDQNPPERPMTCPTCGGKRATDVQGYPNNVLCVNGHPFVGNSDNVAPPFNGPTETPKKHKPSRLAEMLRGTAIPKKVADPYPPFDPTQGLHPAFRTSGNLQLFVIQPAGLPSGGALGSPTVS